MLSKNSTNSGASGSQTPGAEPTNSPSHKRKNVFSDDGFFLERIGRSMKEDEDKKKDQTTLERKKNFANRFKNRGKRPAPEGDAPVDVEGGSDTKGDNHKAKKVKLSQSDAVQRESENVKVPESTTTTAQEDYQRAVGSYNESLKDKGTGVRPLAK